MRFRRHPFVLLCAGLAAWFGFAALHDLFAVALIPLLPACAWMFP